jgi:hypothetical protein
LAKNFAYQPERTFSTISAPLRHVTDRLEQSGNTPKAHGSDVRMAKKRLTKGSCHRAAFLDPFDATSAEGGAATSIPRDITATLPRFWQPE